jgi:DNA-binding NarL/FixJ family response regulator
MSKRVLLADDHHVLRQGLKGLLEQRGFTVVAEAADGRTAVELAKALRPDVALLDILMPGLNGVDAAHEIAAACPGVSIVLLTGASDDRFVLDALRDGVRGFVLKTEATEDLVQAMHQVSRGGIYMSPTVSGVVVRALRAATGVLADELTARERQVLQLIGEGRATKQIAATLKVSVKTAEFHRARIMKKLGVHDTAGLVRYAIRRGWITA